MSEERLELVRDFSSLRAGMLVVVKGCSECGAAHRGMLVFLDKEAEGYQDDGDFAVDVAWEIAPEPTCVPESEWCFTPSKVEDGDVFRVVDEQLDSETLTTRRAEPQQGRQLADLQNAFPQHRGWTR